MVPNEVIEMFGPWGIILAGLAAIVWVTKFIIKDVYTGLKSVTVIADNVSDIPQIRKDLETLLPVAKDLPALQAKVKTLEEEVRVIKEQIVELINHPRMEDFNGSLN